MLNYSATPAVIAAAQPTIIVYYATAANAPSVYQGGDSGIYYIPTADDLAGSIYSWKAKVKAKLDTLYGSMTFNAPNFKWGDNGYVDLLPAQDIPNITKIAVCISRTGEGGATITDYLFYNITEMPQLRASCLRVMIERDVWPEGIFYASNSGVRVNRSNYALGDNSKNNQTVYTTPQAVGNDNSCVREVMSYYGKNAINSYNVAVAALIAYDVQKSLLGLADDVQQQDIFMFYPYYVLNNIDGGSRTVTTPISTNEMRQVINAIAKIYQNLNYVNQDALCVKMWFLPFRSSQLVDTSLDIGAFYSYDEDGERISLGASRMKYDTYVRKFPYFRGLGDVNLDLNPIAGLTDDSDSYEVTYLPYSVGNKTMFGTYLKFIEIPYTVGYGAVEWVMDISQSGISTYLYINGEAVDISDEYAVEFISNTTSMTSERQVAQTLQQMLSLGIAAYGVATGNSVAAIGGLYGATTSLLGLQAQGGSMGKSSGHGNGWTNFADIFGNGTGIDLCFTVFRQVSLLESYEPSQRCCQYCAQHGAGVDFYYNGTVQELVAEMINEWEGSIFIVYTEDNSDTEPLATRAVIAAEVHFSGVPAAVAEQMAQEFAEGVGVELIE